MPRGFAYQSYRQIPGGLKRSGPSCTSARSRCRHRSAAPQRRAAGRLLISERRQPRLPPRSGSGSGWGRDRLVARRRMGAGGPHDGSVRDRRLPQDRRRIRCRRCRAAHSSGTSEATEHLLALGHRPDRRDHRRAPPAPCSEPRSMRPKISPVDPARSTFMSSMLSAPARTTTCCCASIEQTGATSPKPSYSPPRTRLGSSSASGPSTAHEPRAQSADHSQEMRSPSMLRALLSPIAPSLAQSRSLRSRSMMGVPCSRSEDRTGAPWRTPSHLT